MGRCQNIVTHDQPAEIQCPGCEGAGCDECVNGYFLVTECPSNYIGSELIGDIRIVSASEQHLPVAGGLLDQSAWWFQLRERLKSEEYRIQEEQSKRK